MPSVKHLMTNSQILLFGFKIRKKLKPTWLQYVDKANSCDNIVRQAMLNNSFANYMRYMCDNF